MTIVSFDELLNTCSNENKKIYEIAQYEESVFSEETIEMIRIKTLDNIRAMKDAIKNGLKSKEKSISGFSGDDCYKLINGYTKRAPLFGKLFEKVTSYAIATAEENLRMGRIVACPTAGSCGIVPSVLIAVSEELNIDEDKQINALLTAGMIGLIISYKVRLAGAVAGCQAECGVASAMAAAALADILEAEPYQIIQASTLALKNILGLTCDPVCGMVEIPCIKRNAFLAIHAVTAAELAIAGIESKISADEVVNTLKQTGELMSPLLKETSQGGLATTQTALKLKQEIFDRM